MARRNKAEERRIAAGRIERLVELADTALRVGRPLRAQRYARIAWRVKTRYQLRGSAVDARRCRKCGAHLLPGSTARVRLTGGRLSVTCLQCGHVRRRVLGASKRAQGPLGTRSPR